jgi:hypothetical protein
MWQALQQYLCCDENAFRLCENVQLSLAQGIANSPNNLNIKNQESARQLVQRKEPK